MPSKSGKPRKQARAVSDPSPEVKETKPAPAATKAESAAGRPDSTSGAARLLDSQMEMLAGVAGSTARIVHKAASVLEDELNTGIAATGRLEKKLVDIDKLRAADPQAVMQRFRRDAHDVVDILIDLVNVATNGVENLTQRMVQVKIDQPTAKKSAAASRAIPALSVPTPVKAGGEAQIPMMLENESNQQTEAFNLLSSDLVNAAGERIASGQITFSPQEMVLEPHKTASVTVMVHVPENTKPGFYSGLLQASKLEQLRAVLTIQIE